MQQSNPQPPSCSVCNQRLQPHDPSQTQVSTSTVLYLGTINKDNTGCSRVYQHLSIANTRIQITFRPLHLSCYREKIMAIRSTKPGRKINCVFPGGLGEITEADLIGSRNSIIAALLAQNLFYEFQSAFIEIYQHLVESCGLNSLINKGRYQCKKEAWHKNDSYLLALMLKIYKEENQWGKKMRLGEIDSFVKRVEACHEGLHRRVQLLFCEVLRLVVLGGDEQREKKIREMMVDIRGEIVENQFGTVKEQVAFLLGKQLELPLQPQPQLQPQSQSNPKPKPKPKTSLMFKYTKPPQSPIDFLKSLKENLCQICKSPSSCLCLICNVYLCLQCRNEKHQAAAHPKFLLTAVKGSVGIGLEFRTVNLHPDFADLYEKKVEKVEEGQGQGQEDGNENVTGMMCIGNMDDEEKLKGFALNSQSLGRTIFICHDDI